MEFVEANEKTIGVTDTIQCTVVEKVNGVLTMDVTYSIYETDSFLYPKVERLNRTFFVEE
jgi:hypothetical protein